MPRLFAPARPGADPSALAVRLFASTLALAFTSTIAAAADMNMPTKAAATPTYNWSGCYVGLNGGAGTSGTNFTTQVVPGTYLGPADAAEVTNDGTGSRNAFGALGGGQAGCNWQTKTLVVGLEGDFDYFHSNSNYANNTNTLPVLGIPFSINQQTTTDYIATVRPRIGIAADRNFGYITGGVAFTRASYTESYSDANAPPGVGSATASKSLTGWVAGVGWEYAMTDHWLLRFEYLYAAFPTTSATGVITEPGVGTNVLRGSSDLVIQTARAGVNFKF
jgi:outer membrane immunogenic protein